MSHNALFVKHVLAKLRAGVNAEHNKTIVDLYPDVPMVRSSSDDMCVALDFFSRKVQNEIVICARDDLVGSDESLVLPATACIGLEEAWHDHFDCSKALDDLERLVDGADTQ